MRFRTDTLRTPWSNRVMTDAPAITHSDDTVLPLPRVTESWVPSTRDNVEGIVAFSLLGAISCAMLYVAFRLVVWFFA